MSPDVRGSQQVRNVYHASDGRHMEQGHAHVQFPDALQAPYTATAAVSENTYPYNIYTSEPSHYNMPESTMNNPTHRTPIADAYVYQPNSGDTYQPQGGPFSGAGPWRQFADPMEVKDNYIDSASALMALGGREFPPPEAGLSGLPIPDMANLPNLLPDVHMNPTPQPQPWPSGLLNLGHKRVNR